MNGNQDDLAGHQDSAVGGESQFLGQPGPQPPDSYGSLQTDGRTSFMAQGQAPMGLVPANRMPMFPMQQQQQAPNSGMLPIPSGCPANALPGNVGNMRFPQPPPANMHAQYPNIGGSNSQNSSESSGATIVPSENSDISHNSQCNPSGFPMYPSLLQYDASEQNIAYYVPCPPDNNLQNGADHLTGAESSTFAFPQQFHHAQQQMMFSQQPLQQQDGEAPTSELRIPVPSESTSQMNPNVFPGEQFQFQESLQQMHQMEKQSFQEETQHKLNDQQLSNNSASQFCQGAVPNQNFIPNQHTSINCQTETTMMQNTNLQMQPIPQVQTTQTDENRGFQIIQQQQQNFVMATQPTRFQNPAMQSAMMPQQMGSMPTLVSQMVPMSVSSQSVGPMPPKPQRMPIASQNEVSAVLMNHPERGKMPISQNTQQMTGSLHHPAHGLPANIPQDIQRLPNPSQNTLPMDVSSSLSIPAKMTGPRMNLKMAVPAGQMVYPANAQSMIVNSQQRLSQNPAGLRPRFMQPRIMNPMQQGFVPRPMADAMRNTAPILQQQQPSLSRDQPHPSNMVPLSMPLQPRAFSTQQLHMTPGGPTSTGHVIVPGPNLTPQMDKVQSPWGWKRVLLGDKIVYFTPSGIQLNSKDEIKDYLMTEGTCKCGLDCPLVIERAFDFDQSKPTEITQPNSIPVMNNGCKHVKDTLAIAQIQTSTGFAVRHHHNPILSKSKGMLDYWISNLILNKIFTLNVLDQLKKKIVKTKKKPFSGVKVSQMLAAREAEKQKQRIVEVSIKVEFYNFNK